MPDEPEQHADSKKDDPGEAVIYSEHKNGKDPHKQAAQAQEHPATIQKPIIPTTAIAIAAVSISAPSSLCSWSQSLVGLDATQALRLSLRGRRGTRVADASNR
jgi:hypothetical protein